MKTLRILFICIAALAVLACSENKDDTYYASKASNYSSDSSFTSTDSGGTVSLGAEGGSVIINTRVRELL